MAIFTLQGRYDNFLTFLRIRHYNFDKLVEIFGFRTTETKAGQFIEDIAYNELNDATLAWTIVAINKRILLENILDPLPGGLTLRIPSDDLLFNMNTPDRKKV